MKAVRPSFEVTPAAAGPYDAASTEAAPARPHEPGSRTWGWTPVSGSALDPLVAEITWIAREMTAADSRGLDPESIKAITGRFDHLVETAWRPGRSVILTEAATIPADDDTMRLRCRIAIGMLGPEGSTALEIAGIRPALDELTDAPGRTPYRARNIDPAEMFAPPDVINLTHTAEHSALIRQRTVAVGVGSETVDVVSRFHPTVEPWLTISRRLVAFDRPVTVRATMLATGLSPLDRLELDHAVTRLHAIAERAPANIRFDLVSQVDRGLATLIDLQASYTSPVFIAEIAVRSPQPLPESFIRSISAALTSETEVHRQDGGVIVAGHRHILGGFEIERDPEGLALALATGLPLRGGTGPRELRDLVTLTESPIGWPVPSGGPIPTVDPLPASDRPVPQRLRAPNGNAEDATVLGTSEDGSSIAHPIELRPLHTLITGTWGSGKSTVLTRMALDDLRNGRPFLFIDPHGTAADWLCAFAEFLGVPVIVLDPEDGDTSRLSPFPKLRTDGRNRTQVEDAVAHLADAVASSLSDPDWAGPRWQATVRSMFEVGAAHGAELAEVVTWLNDPRELSIRLDHASVSPLARSTLGNLSRGPSSDADSVRGWASSKLHAIASGPARRIFDRAGSGIDLADAVGKGVPIIVNLGALSTSEAELVGHLTLARVLHAAMHRAPDARTLFSCYVDEAHRFPVRGLSRVLAEGRKFGIGLVLATQALSQLPGELADLAMGVGTSIAFRATPDTAGRLSVLFDTPPAELTRLPDLRCAIAVAGVGATQIAVPPYESCPIERTKRPPHARRRTRAKKRKVTAPSSPQPAMPPTSTGSTILDEWLAKRTDALVDADEMAK